MFLSSKHFKLEHISVYYNFDLQSGQFTEDMIPTVGFNMRKITKGNVTIKVAHTSFKNIDSLNLCKENHCEVIDHFYFSYGTLEDNQDSDQCGSDTVEVLMQLCKFK